MTSAFLENPMLVKGMRMYMDENPILIKQLSNTAKVYLEKLGRAEDLTNWVYNCIYSSIYEMARAMYPETFVIMEELSDKWPSLSRQWQATKKSVVRKGDVIEICIANCDKQLQVNPAESRSFLESCAKYHEALEDIIGLVCCSDDKVTKQCLPHPYHFVRLLHFAHFSKRHHVPVVGHAFYVKAYAEMKSLQTKVGETSWV